MVDADDGTWRYDWPAGARLLAELSSLVEVRGRRVIDLGCGSGRLGRWAAAAGAAAVLFADQSPAALAAIPPVPGCAMLVHRWGEALPPCDLLLGGDILYRPALFPALLDSVATALADGGAALLADPRARLEDELPQLAAARGLGWMVERRPGPYTLVRLRRCPPDGRVAG
jgi:predicted nicotinamide N-methyase